MGTFKVRPYNLSACLPELTLRIQTYMRRSIRKARTVCLWIPWFCWNVFIPPIKWLQVQTGSALSSYFQACSSQTSKQLLCCMTSAVWNGVLRQSLTCTFRLTISCSMRLLRKFKSSDWLRFIRKVKALIGLNDDKNNVAGVLCEVNVELYTMQCEEQWTSTTFLHNNVVPSI